MGKKNGNVLISSIIFFLFFSITAYGAGSVINKKINVTYRNIKVFVDGKEIKSEEPFVLKDKGVTMIPVRAVSQALGKNVTWDEQKNIIYIGTGQASVPASSTIPQKSSEKTVWIEDMTVIRNVGPFYQQKGKNFYIAAGPHEHGIAVQVEENGSAEVVLRLDDTYTGVKGWLGVGDETMNTSGAFELTILADNREVYHSQTVLPASYPIYVDHRNMSGISGARTLKFQIKWVPSGLVGDYKKVTATLADFKLVK